MQKLYVIGVYSNPLLWSRRLELAKRWITDMLETEGIELVVGEVAHGDRPFELNHLGPKYTHIEFRAETMAWSKESAINECIKRLPPDAEYVCWSDMDVEFRDPKWAVKTVQALQLWPVIQPWSEALDLGPQGEVMEIKGEHIQTSLGKLYRTTGQIFTPGQYGTYGHPGYVWAATMEFLQDVGLLLDTSGLGAADHQMAMGILGMPERSIHSQTTIKYQAHVLAWCDRAYKSSLGHLGYIEGRIEHWFHGKKVNRKYQERWQVLIDHQFDPIVDMVRNRYGIVEITDKKPQMRRDMERYYVERDEDCNRKD